jgi:hypothetical protein
LPLLHLFYPFNNVPYLSSFFPFLPI